MTTLEELATGKIDQCRYCKQWYNRAELDLDLYGYCSADCMEIDYSTFRDSYRRLNYVSNSS